MMSSGEYLQLTGDKVVVPKKPTMKRVFSGKIISSNNNNNRMSDAPSKHNLSKDELSGMKITQLKSLVKEHNLHNQIKRYTTMKKAALVDALMEHQAKRRGRPKKEAPPTALPSTPKKKQAVARTPQDKPKPKRRIAPMLVSTETGKSPMKSKGGKGSSIRGRPWTKRSPVDHIKLPKTVVDHDNDHQKTRLRPAKHPFLSISHPTKIPFR